jgi:outer membrane protein
MTRSLSHAALVLWTAASLIVSPAYAQAQQPPSPPQSQSSSQTQTQSQAPPSQPSAPGQSQSQAPQNAAENQTSTPSTATGPITPKNLQLHSDYWKGKSFFPDIFAPYSPRKVEQPSLVNTPKIDQLIEDGKLNLSLDDAIALALENNLDIRVQRYNAWIIDTQLLKAQAGGIPQPASAQQVVLGLPPSVSFDPVLTSQVNWSRSVVPVNQIFTTGFGTGASQAFQFIFYSANYNFGYTQGFHTGTSISLQWQNNRGSTNSPGYLFNPFVQSTLTFGISQPLLNGCCRLPSTRFIIEAKNSTKIAAAQFAQSVITDITTTSDDYWELVYDREFVKVEEQAVAVSQKLYEDNKKQLEIGTMAPLDVLTAESQLATDKQNLVAAQTAKLLQETKLLNDITKNPFVPNLRNVEIVPTTPIETPDVVENVDLNDLMTEAWQNRPEVTQARLTLENDKIEVKVTRNGLLPSLNLFGQYQGTGLAGNNTTFNATQTGFAADLTAPIVDANGTPTSNPALYASTPTYAITALAHQAGLSSALNSMINASFPTYAAGINFSMPFRNRSAQADNARAMLSERQEEVAYQQLKNTIFVNVRQAQVALSQDRTQVSAAAEATKLAQQTLDDEQKKYQLGSSTSYQVVLRARDLTLAQSTELRARVSLIEAAIAFNQAMGRTLEANKITLADAFRGRVSRTPNIPGALDTDDPVPAHYDSWAPGKK